MEPLDCTGCTECCRWVTFIMQWEPENFKTYAEFYTARGCKIKMLQGAVAVVVPSVCPNLNSNGCSIYESRPKACRDYDCRADKFLEGGNYYGQRKT